MKGPEHPNTLTSASNLAMSLCNQDKYADAEWIQREMLRVQKRVLGDHRLFRQNPLDCRCEERLTVGCVVMPVQGRTERPSKMLIRSHNHHVRPVARLSIETRVASLACVRRMWVCPYLCRYVYMRACVRVCVWVGVQCCDMWAGRDAAQTACTRLVYLYKVAPCAANLR